uniref:Lipase domain-containing protein n=1 Tax=Macrostomum lignano TaxID=282301 RepID=A0A1I8FCN1_9PLAT
MTTTWCLILALVASLAAALPQPQEVKEPKTASNEGLLRWPRLLQHWRQLLRLSPTALQLLPQSPERIGPTYALYTRRSIISGQSLVYGDKSSVEKSNFDASRPTKIIIHGFLENGSEDWRERHEEGAAAARGLQRDPAGLEPRNQLPYTQATANTRVIGAMIAQMIVWLEGEFGASRTSFHLLGHSSRAHVSGYARTAARTGQDHRHGPGAGDYKRYPCGLLCRTSKPADAPPAAATPACAFMACAPTSGGHATCYQRERDWRGRSSELTVFSKEYITLETGRTALMTSPDSRVQTWLRIHRVLGSTGGCWPFNISGCRINRIEIFEGPDEKRSLFCASDVSIDSWQGPSLLGRRMLAENKCGTLIREAELAQLTPNTRDLLGFYKKATT